MALGTQEEYEKARQQIDDLTEFPGWESSFIGLVTELAEAIDDYENRYNIEQSLKWVNQP